MNDEVEQGVEGQVKEDLQTMVKMYQSYADNMLAIVCRSSLTWPSTPCSTSSFIAYLLAFVPSTCCLQSCYCSVQPIFVPGAMYRHRRIGNAHTSSRMTCHSWGRTLVHAATKSPQSPASYCLPTRQAVPR